MNALISRSTNSEALLAELHRDDLIRDAAASRLARAAAATAPAAVGSNGAGLVARIRFALVSSGRPAQPECPECA